jgi:hypothetical protein
LWKIVCSGLYERSRLDWMMALSKGQKVPDAKRYDPEEVRFKLREAKVLFGLAL